MADAVKAILKAREHDGMIVGPVAGMHRQIGRLFEDAVIPTVLIKPYEAVPAHYVVVDMAGATYDAARHLHDVGCRHIRFFGPIRAQGQWGRRAGLTRFLSEFRPQESLAEFVVAADGCVDSGYEAARREFRKGQAPDGILCQNDLCAIGVMMAAKECGLRIPEDVAVVGIDDIAQAGRTVPPLTTMRQPREDMARHVVRILLGCFEAPDAPVRQQVVLSPKLVVRKSTMRAPCRSRREEHATVSVPGGWADE